MCALKIIFIKESFPRYTYSRMEVICNKTQRYFVMHTYKTMDIISHAIVL